ncbi:endoglycoceramidase, partial [Mycolicibacter heraklionensis]
GQGLVGGIGGHGGDGGWLFGMGGHGGAGGDGGAGGHGGDGGDAIGVLGSGGNGGSGGESGIGSAPAGLPALGGAGGNGSMLGSHGVVGHFGTGIPLSGGSGGFSTADTWITDSAGRVVILHGLDEVYKLSPYEPSASGFGDDDAAFLAANGFNSVGLGIVWAALEPEPGVFSQTYLDSIAETVQTLSNHGIVTVLGMHQDLYSTVFGGEGAPDWAVQTGGLPNPDFGFPNSYYLNPAEMYAWDTFWSNAPASDGVGLENHYALAWEYVADYFKDDPNVVGLNIMTEPSAGSQWLSSMLGNPHFDAQQLTPFYNQVTSAIRAVDPNTTVYFQHNVNFDLGFPTHLGTVNDPNKAFEFAYFCPTSLLGDGLFCDVLDDMALNNVVAYAGAHNIPALMGGFGATDNIAVIIDMLRGASQRHYGWTEWAYTGKDDITTGASSQNSEALVFDPSKPPVGDNVNVATLAALAEPYPQAVAGTPSSWSFDHGIFQLSYATARADGTGSFAAGAQTTISVPAIQYPHGYQVSVTGGHVVSIPNVPVLIIASDAGATTVNVVVAPAH